MAVRVIPYKAGSQSARTLADALGGRRLRLRQSLWRGGPNDTIINWGYGRLQDWPFVFTPDDARILNKPEAVAIASNKLKFLQALDGTDVSVPPWTESANTAQEWVNGGATVLSRTRLQGSGGAGIVKNNQREIDIELAPLYTKYVPKASEWRVHVLKGEVFHIQRKIKDPDVEEPFDWQIRNHENGFIFQIEYDVEAWHDKIGEQAIKAVQAIGLDFGAVDVIWNNLSSSAYVLEINTAPGLEGQTIQKYSEAFQNALLHLR